MDRSGKYDQHLPSYTGFKARVVNIGGLELGGDNPIRIQSMTNTPTMDTESTVRQVIALANAGCELVRITAQNVREAHHLNILKKELRRKGITVPIAADIHYLPEAALVAAQIVEKVRINPGNYTENKKAGTAISDKAYEEELEKIAERLYPLLAVCKENGTAIRIGTNHGSLSDRIVYRYGNTPVGMVESAMEFARICQGFGFDQLVLSMKASNILTVLHSNRLLAAKMKAEGMDYPIHLGVTEAGEGEDGRIKSAAGIGILLSEGIGDTIRVSLTEDPIMEIPFAATLASMFNREGKRSRQGDVPEGLHPYYYSRHPSPEAGKMGGNQVPLVWGEGFPTPELETSELETPELETVSNFIQLVSPPEEKAAALRGKLLRTITENPGKPIFINKNLGPLHGDELLIRASIDLGMALTDGFGDGIQVSGGSGLDEAQRVKLAFDILQATGRRITRTEYISCPSCGRTRFDIQQALRKVKEKTSHLVGLKIAVMGCIVNGPGEMADADFGYVGAGPGKVHIYKGHKLIIRNVPEEDAVEVLLGVIEGTSEKSR